MGQSRHSGVGKRGRRRWAFAGCLFDEANWSLIVDGARIPVESKPLELLRLLLLRAGDVVSKDELLDTIWPDVVVVEASLPTAVGKLRRALGDDRRDKPIIETVSRIGYRIATPVDLEEQAGPAPTAPDATGPVELHTPVGQRSPTGRQPVLLVAGALAAAALVLLAVTAPRQAEPASVGYTQTDAANALRRLDVTTIEKMLAAGWNPNTPFDDQNNGAVNIVLGVCEWDPDHDRRQLLLMVRTLLDGGAHLADRNAWGDTPYSIAKADRYCGPNHPVTKMIRMFCFEGGNPIGDRCLADYRRDASGAVVRRY